MFLVKSSLRSFRAPHTLQFLGLCSTSSAFDSGLRATAELFVSNVPFGLSNEDLRQIVAREIGESSFDSVKLSKSRSDNPQARNSGFGFIQFREKQAAVDALAVLRNAAVMVGDRQLKFEIGEKKTARRPPQQQQQKVEDTGMGMNMFIGGLPPDVTFAELKDLVKTCIPSEEVLRVSVRPTPAGDAQPPAPACGFVVVASQASAEKLRQGLSSVTLRDFKVVVEPARTKFSPRMQRPERTWRLFVGNLSYQMTSELLEEMVRDVAGPEGFMYGEAKFSEPGFSRGYGFLTFSSKEAADAAISLLHGLEVMGRTLLVELSVPKAKNDNY